VGRSSKVLLMLCCCVVCIENMGLRITAYVIGTEQKYFRLGCGAVLSGRNCWEPGHDLLALSPYPFPNMAAVDSSAASISLKLQVRESSYN
jgi:hypothetical protein